MKIYPDQPQSETRAEGDDLVVTKTTKAALVPAAPGTLTLPELKIQWWDTRTQQARVATLPARTIDVLPGIPGSKRPVVSSEPETLVPSEAPPAPPESTGVPARTLTGAAGWQASYWPWLAGGAALGWLVTLILWVRARARRRADSGTPDLAGGSSSASPRQRLAQGQDQVRKACLSNDPKAARIALLDWGRARWPDAPPRGLPELARRFATEGSRSQIAALDRLLYDADARRTWDGRTTWSILEPALKDVTPDGDRGKAEPLPDLYPQHG